MPSAWAHSHYWQHERADAPEGQVGASARGGYVPFQTTVTIGSLFGAVQALYERWVKR